MAKLKSSTPEVRYADKPGKDAAASLFIQQVEVNWNELQAVSERYSNAIYPLFNPLFQSIGMIQYEA